MIELIRRDIERYNNGSGNILLTAIRAAYSHPSFIGVIWYRIGHALWLRRKNPVWLILFTISRALYPLVRMYSGLELSPRAQIGGGMYIGHFGPTVIHPDTVAGCNLTILQGVTIGAGTGGIPHIGNDVSIGVGATIIGGITVGNHATIGAGAVVTKDIPDGCVAVGVPAKPVGSENYL
jgi:serine O-acetyltransferase